MAFADPLSITISGTANTLARVSSEGMSSTYQTADGLVRLVVSHRKVNRTGRWQRQYRFYQKKVAADPLASGVNKEFSESFAILLDVPEVGFSIAETKAFIDGVLAHLNASSGAQITKFIGGES